MRHFITKWTVWEFLPWWLANGPVYLVYAWYALRARHLFFFTNVNPSIPLAGAMGESKHDILAQLPPEIVPKTVLIAANEPIALVPDKMKQAGIEFPLIAKPDVGERGFLVRKINDVTELEEHLNRYPVDFILQEFLTEPLEMTVLFYRFPEQGRFGINSVCVKEFLSVTGDGQSTVAELMTRTARASFQLGRFEKEFPDLLVKIPVPGEQLLLEPIGNHARGTKFLNGNDLIDDRLVAAIEPICRQMDGILLGRFDLKCASVEAIRNGRFKVMELNGIFGEPAHVYDPTYGMWRAYRDFFRQWNLIFRLYRAQKGLGIRPTSHRKSFRLMQDYFRYKKQFE
jgi:hypothetical protein